MAKKYYYKNYRKQDTFEQEATLFVALGVLFVFFLAGLYQIYIKPNLESIVLYGSIAVTVFCAVIGYYLFIRYQKKKQRLAQMPDVVRELIQDIQSFHPFSYGKEEKEICYQAELGGYLKSKYPQVKYEEERNFVRCDLSVNDIGIEIKGPTTMESLKTLPDKVNAYVPVWEYLIIVLFNVKIVDYNKVRNEDAYKVKKEQIIANIPPEKRDKVFFVRIG